MTESEYIKMLMQNLHCTEEAARDVMETDRAIDRGADPFPLTADQKAVEKKMRQGKRAPTAYKFETKKHKPNELKEEIVSKIATFLSENADFNPENVEITNKNRIIVFSIGKKRFELTLVEKRPPKN